ncbi:hypothetical protein SLEP1_g25244 [Rubroshorea leprosula]|uniref:Uncharacterized protein n=1 Tax=Rubroshorea leprosula TaxID=152421 RepID=A0AAV5JIA6_9ROSI|nr:hypothetical protein SLEP1_g25244 [Rubroshorea leprosula]
MISKTFPIKPKLKPKPRTQSQIPESKYWCSFKSTQITTLIPSISSVSFSPSTPHVFASAHSTSLSYFPLSLSDLDVATSSSISFLDVVSSLSFRHDILLPAAANLSNSVQYWDVAGESVVLDLVGHKDYVRYGDCSPVSGDMLVTGSYDHTVKVWDVRVENPRSVLEVNHGKPEDVIYLPSGG